MRELQVEQSARSRAEECERRDARVDGEHSAAPLVRRDRVLERRAHALLLRPTALHVHVEEQLSASLCARMCNGTSSRVYGCPAQGRSKVQFCAAF